MEEVPKRLIVDTSVLIPFIITDGITRRLILEERFELYTISEALVEIWESKDEWNRRKMHDQDIRKLLDLMLTRIIVIHHKDFKDSIKEAYKIMKDIHVNDTPFLAAAMHLNSPVWSNDAHFKKQKKVKVYSTRELLELMSY